MRVEGLRRRSFVVRYLTLFGGEATSKCLVLAAFGYLARVLGPRDFGIVELALSTTVFFLLGAETGLGSFAARTIETTPQAAAHLVPQAGLLRAMLAVPAYGAILVISSQYGTARIGLLAIYGLTVLLTPFNTQWVFQGLRQMQWVAVGSLLRYGTFATLVLLLVRAGSSTRLVALAEVSGAIALAIFNTTLLRRALRIHLDRRGVWRGAFDLFARVWFLGASDLTWAAMWYSPTIILGWTSLGHTEHVAWLAAAVRIVMALHTFVFLYFFNLVPNLSRELLHGLESWRGLVARSMSIAMWAAFAVALAGTLLAPTVVLMLFGHDYADAVRPLQIVVWMIPLTWLSGHFRFSLIVSGHQHLEFMASAVAGVTTVVLAVVGARTYGAPGAAAALLIGGAVNTVVAGMATFRVIGSVPLRTALPALLTCAAMIALGILSARLIGPQPAGLGACLIYAGVATSQWDLNRVREAWEGRL